MGSSGFVARCALRKCAKPARVCQAWHRTSEVKVLAPGSRGAEGQEKDRGSIMRLGLEDAQLTSPVRVPACADAYRDSRSEENLKRTTLCAIRMYGGVGWERP